MSNKPEQIIEKAIKNGDISNLSLGELAVTHYPVADFFEIEQPMQVTIICKNFKMLIKGCMFSTCKKINAVFLQDLHFIKTDNKFLPRHRILAQDLILISDVDLTDSDIFTATQCSDGILYIPTSYNIAEFYVKKFCRKKHIHKEIHVLLNQELENLKNRSCSTL